MVHSRIVKMLVVAALSSTSAVPALAQEAAAPSPPPESVFVYFADEIPRPNTTDTLQPGAILAGVTPAVVQRRQSDPILDRCRAAEPESPAFLVPLIGFGVKLFGSVLERHLAAREARRIASLSRTYAQVRADETFPLSTTGPNIRCLVIDRGTFSGGDYQPGAIFVLLLQRVGSSPGFTIEPLAARIETSSIAALARPPRLNATVSLTMQSIFPNAAGVNEQATLPVYSVSFEGLTVGQSKDAPRRRSAVLPIAGRPGVPTSIAVSVTESHASLDSVRQQIALEQANRAALLTAVGESVKAAVTD